jgi:hypothetical protein
LSVLIPWSERVLLISKSVKSIHALAPQNKLDTREDEDGISYMGLMFDSETRAQHENI